MKKLLLLPALILGFSFACDQPYEEIAGIKIGCPYEGNLALGYKDKDDDQIIHFSERMKDGFFDRVKIKVLDGNVEEISFLNLSKDHDDIKSGGDALFEALNERWGNADITQELNIETVYSFKNMDDSILYEIFAKRVLMEPVSSMTVVYTSKKMKDHIDSRKTSRYQQFQGF